MRREGETKYTMHKRGTNRMNKRNKTNRGGKRVAMVHIPIDTGVLQLMKEGQILTLVAQEVELNNPGQNGKDVIAGWLQSAGTGSSKTHVRNACEGRTCIGYVGWAVLVKRSGTKLYDQWCHAVKEVLQ